MVNIREVKADFNNFYKDGECYVPMYDKGRLWTQHNRIFFLMQDGEWRTLSDIERHTGDPQASISATLRDFRKERFGSHTVNKRRLGDPKRGLFEYALVLNRESQMAKVIFDGDTITLTERLNTKEWTKLYNKLKTLGYHYVPKSNGVWKRHRVQKRR